MAKINKNLVLCVLLSIIMVCSVMVVFNYDATSSVAYATSDNYLTFTATEDSSSVTFRYNAGSVEYSKNGDTFATYSAGTSISLNKDEYVQFKGTNVTTNSSYHFSMTGKIAASGDVTSLTNETGGDETLSNNCYSYMFSGCSSLITAPALPATTLALYCYQYMFLNCTALTAAPTLPATTLAANCYESMFQGCSSLVNAPQIDAETVGNYSCRYMFYRCSSLTTVPDLQFVTINKNGCESMFEECTSLVTAPVFTSVTSVGENGCLEMFVGCTKLKNVSTLSATTLGSSCYAYMFKDCTALETAPSLPATTLAVCCYQYMFYGCTSLTTAPALPATTLLGSCYVCMFQRCTSLVNAPQIDAQTVANYSCQYMFYYCTSLTTVPDLPFVTINKNGCESMFESCTSLVTAPIFTSVTSVGENGCLEMFAGCTKLKNVSTLSATTLGSSCYYYMFKDCTALETAPSLPATTLAVCCYQYMFYGCTSLTTAPALPATTLLGSCYSCMFQRCTSLVNAPQIDAQTVGNYSCQYMFYYCTSLTTIPDLPFVTIGKDGCDSMFQECTSLVTAPKFASVTTVGEKGCYKMFSGCTKLKNVSTLSATTLGVNCYEEMFFGCTALETAPSLPATTLASYCYDQMFYGCTSLTTAPALPATALASACYYAMFEACSGLVNAPQIDAQTVESYSCYAMFYRCSKLTIAQDFSFTTIANYGCYRMFQECNSLLIAPSFTSVTSIGNYGLKEMFYGCTSLKISNTYDATDYPNAWTIPNATAGTDWNNNMFYNCTNVSITPAVNTTYYQQAIKNIVSYNNNGATGTTPTESNTFNVGEVITLNDGTGLTKTGYKFLGWNTNKNASTGNTGDYTIVSSDVVSGSITFYAIWAHVHGVEGNVDYVVFNKPLSLAIIQSSFARHGDGSSENPYYRAILESGNFYLIEDITIDYQLVVHATNDVKICLNGYTLDLNGTNIKNLGTLTIYDCGTTGKITGGYAIKGGAIYNVGDSTLTINGGTITENTAGDYGGAIYNEGGNVIINGGVISNNNTAYHDGGAIYNNILNTTPSTLIINDGTFENNVAETSGGFIYNKESKVTINGGTISNNSATENGGAIYNENGNVTITAGTISNNTASTNGSGIYCNGTLTVGGSANVTGNTMDNVYLPLGKLMSLGDGTSTYTYKDASGATQNVPAPTTMSIGITSAYNTGSFLTNASSDAYTSKFTSDNPDFIVIANKLNGTPTKYFYELSIIKTQPSSSNDYQVAIQSTDEATYQWHKVVYTETAISYDLNPTNTESASVITANGNQIVITSTSFFALQFSTTATLLDGVEKVDGKYNYLSTYNYKAFRLVINCASDFAISDLKWFLVTDTEISTDTSNKLSSATEDANYYCVVTLKTYPNAVSSSVKTSSVTFDGNTSTGGTAPETLYQLNGRNIIMPACTYTKTGCVFKEWNTEDDGTGTAYLAGASYQVSADDVTLYAMFTFKAPDHVCHGITFDKYFEDYWDSTTGYITTGNYYLKNNLAPNTNIRIASGQTVNICLNGKYLDITSYIVNNGELGLYDCDTTTVNYFSKDENTGLYSISNNVEVNQTIGGFITSTNGATKLIEVTGTNASLIIDGVDIVGMNIGTELIDIHEVGSKTMAINNAKFLGNLLNYGPVITSEANISITKCDIKHNSMWYAVSAFNVDVLLDDCNITNNKGVAVYMVTDNDNPLNNLTLIDCIIENNSYTFPTVSVFGNVVVKIGGDTVVQNNISTRDDSNCNIGLFDGAKIGLLTGDDAPTSSAAAGVQIGVINGPLMYYSSLGTFMAGAIKANKEIFTSDNGDFNVYFDSTSSELWIAHIHEDIVFNKYLSNSFTGGTLTAGNYCLLEDVTVTGSFKIAGGAIVNICLNGHKLTLDKQSGDRHEVFAGATLNFYDDETQGELVLTGYNDAITMTSATLNLNSVKVYGNKGFNAEEESTMNVNNSSISTYGNYSICAKEKSQVNINNSTITHTSGGSGILAAADDDTVITISKSTIKNNSVDSDFTIDITNGAILNIEDDVYVDVINNSVIFVENGATLNINGECEIVNPSEIEDQNRAIGVYDGAFVNINCSDINISAGVAFCIVDYDDEESIIYVKDDFDDDVNMTIYYYFISNDFARTIFNYSKGIDLSNNFEAVQPKNNDYYFFKFGETEGTINIFGVLTDVDNKTVTTTHDDSTYQWYKIREELSYLDDSIGVKQENDTPDYETPVYQGDGWWKSDGGIYVTISKGTSNVQAYIPEFDPDGNRNKFVAGSSSISLSSLKPFSVYIYDKTHTAITTESSFKDDYYGTFKGDGMWDAKEYNSGYYGKYYYLDLDAYTGMYTEYDIYLYGEIYLNNVADVGNYFYVTWSGETYFKFLKTNIIFESELSGETTNTLSNNTPAGEYMCKVSADGKYLLSEKIVIPFAIKTQPSATNDFEFVTNDSEGNKATYQWYLDGVAISGKTSSKLGTITAKGEYYCKATLDDVTVQSNSIYGIKVTFNANGATGTVPSDAYYIVGANVSFPTVGNMVITGKRFIGWNTNKDATEALESYAQTENKDVTLYAIWVAKTSISVITDGCMQVTYDGTKKAYEVECLTDSTLEFVITYYIGTNQVDPINAGTYDVKLYRAEDSNYKEFSKTLKGAFVINKGQAVITLAEGYKKEFVKGEQVVLPDATSNFGTIEKVYDASLLSSPQVGAYSVKYKVVDDINGNYLGVEEEFVITIINKTINIDVNQDDLDEVAAQYKDPGKGFDSNTKLVVVKKDADENNTNACIKAVNKSNIEVSLLFDVSLVKDGVKVSPNGTLELSLTISEELQANTSLRILSISESGTAELITDFEIIDGKVVFSTDELTSYAIVVDANNDEANDSVLTAGEIAGISVGGVIFILVLIYLIGAYLYKKNKLNGKFFDAIYAWVSKEKKEEENNDNQDGSDQTQEQQQ